LLTKPREAKELLQEMFERSFGVFLNDFWSDKVCSLDLISTNPALMELSMVEDRVEVMPQCGSGMAGKALCQRGRVE
jgi:hypothetical protein